MDPAEEVRKLIIKKLRAGVRPAHIARDLGINRARVYRTKTLFEATGDVKRRIRRNFEPQKRTRNVVQAVRARIHRNPRRTARGLARDFNMSAMTMSKLIKTDLGLKNRAVTRRHFISPLQKQKRVERSRKLLNFIKHRPGTVTVFSDEKLFYVDAVFNRRCDRFLASGSIGDVP